MIRAFFIVVAFGVLTGLYALFIEPRQLKVRFHTVGSGPETVRFVLIADLHMGGFHTSARQVQGWVERINAEQPDFILIPGDFIDGHEPRAQVSDKTKKEIQTGFESLSRLNAPAFATIGNHDVWHSRHYVETALSDIGIVWLTNRAVKRGGFCFVGIDDHDTGHPSPAGFAECDDQDNIIALMHSPDSRHLLDQRVRLAVAGHTHGGQINLPVLGRNVTSTQCGKPCAYGWVQQRPALYVTSGVGTSILPVRFRSSPEIAVITLRY